MAAMSVIKSGSFSEYFDNDEGFLDAIYNLDIDIPGDKVDGGVGRITDNGKRKRPIESDREQPEDGPPTKLAKSQKPNDASNEEEAGFDIYGVYHNYAVLCHDITPLQERLDLANLAIT